MQAADKEFHMVTRTRASTVFGIVAVAAIALLYLAPFYAKREILQDLFFVLTMLVLAANWNLLAGYAGLMSVGQQLFVGLGAYSMFAVVILWGLDPLLGLPLGGIIAVLIAIPTAIFTFRLRGAYFAVATWVFAEVARLAFSQWKSLGGGTGMSLPNGTTKSMFGVHALRELFGVNTAYAVEILTYLIALTLALLTIITIYFFLRTKAGLGLTAVRDNQDAAKSVGIHATALKVLVFLVTAFGTGMCGALIYIQKARISPDAAFSVIDWTAYVIFIVIIGGIGSIEGPIVGVIALFLLQKFFADFGAVYLIALGMFSIVTMLFAPEGVWGLFSRRLGIQLFPLQRLLKVIVPNKT
jgi:branched-chain amino acid transport system permease protein